jgi:hypothetical protein
LTTWWKDLMYLFGCGLLQIWGNVTQSFDTCGTDFMGSLGCMTQLIYQI